MHTTTAVSPSPSVQIFFGQAPTFTRTGHVSLDPTTVSHCPFCGGGALTGQSDGGVECSICNRSFVVSEQPLFSNMPSAEQGANVDSFATDPLGQEESFEPGDEAVPPEAGDETGDGDAPPADDEEPDAEVIPVTLATRSGALVHIDDFVMHHAIRCARGE